MILGDLLGGSMRTKSCGWHCGKLVSAGLACNVDRAERAGFMNQLPNLLKHAEPPPHGQIPASLTTSRRRATAATPSTPGNEATGEKQYTYIPSRFFSDQLTAFEVWISRGGSALTKRGPLSLPLSRDQSPTPEQNGSANPYPPVTTAESTKDLVPRKPPDQLPIVLQVLLSQPHRLRLSDRPFPRDLAPRRTAGPTGTNETCC